MLNKLLVKLFTFFRFWTLILYLSAILYKLSPDFTVYVVVVLVSGIISSWPIISVLFVRPLAFFNSSIVVLYFWATEYRLSPDFTT